MKRPEEFTRGEGDGVLAASSEAVSDGDGMKEDDWSELMCGEEMRERFWIGDETWEGVGEFWKE